MKNQLLILLLLAAFTGCYTEKKAADQATRAMNVYPIKVLPIFRDKFPCIQVKSDTTIILTDTTITINCPDEPTPATDYFTLHDTVTVTKPVTKIVKVPVTLPVRTQVITKYIEDESKVKVAELKIAERDKKIEQLQGKIDSKNKWILWLIITLLGSLFVNFWPMIKKIKIL